MFSPVFEDTRSVKVLPKYLGNVEPTEHAGQHTKTELGNHATVLRLKLHSSTPHHSACQQVQSSISRFLQLRSQSGLLSLVCMDKALG